MPLKVLVVFDIEYTMQIRKIPILMYHSINDSLSEDRIRVPVHRFRRDMRWLADAGYKAVSLEEIFTYGTMWHPKIVGLTFDDGYRDNYEQAFPILKKCRFFGTIFVVTEWVGQENYLTWEQIREMSAYGITFGSHTCSHPWLSRLSVEEVRAEILESKKTIEAQIDKEVKFFCYPYGDYNQYTKQLTKEGGYLTAFGGSYNRKHPDEDLYSIKRIRISARDTQLWKLRFKVSGYYAWLRKIQKSGSVCLKTQSVF
jgi:peptidoglycan/xylan/chitin deacetylase (PgdA/CDA1 family)